MAETPSPSPAPTSSGKPLIISHGHHHHHLERERKEGGIPKAVDPISVQTMDGQKVVGGQQTGESGVSERERERAQKGSRI